MPTLSSDDRNIAGAHASLRHWPYSLARSLQITKFSTDWELLKAELLQVGHIYDEGVAANLEQVGHNPL